VLAATTPLAALYGLGSVIMLNDVARPPHAHGDSAALALTASVCWQGTSAVDWRAWRSGAVLLLWDPRRRGSNRNHEYKG